MSRIAVQDMWSSRTSSKILESSRLLRPNRHRAVQGGICGCVEGETLLGIFGEATTEVTSHALLMYTGRTEQGRHSYRESGIQPDRGEKNQGKIINPLNSSPHLSSASSIPPSPGWTTPSNPRSSPPTPPPTVPLAPAALSLLRWGRFRQETSSHARNGAIFLSTEREAFVNDE